LSVFRKKTTSSNGCRKRKKNQICWGGGGKGKNRKEKNVPPNGVGFVRGGKTKMTPCPEKGGCRLKTKTKKARQGGGKKDRFLVGKPVQRKGRKIRWGRPLVKNLGSGVWKKKRPLPGKNPVGTGGGFFGGSQTHPWRGDRKL